MIPKLTDFAKPDGPFKRRKFSFKKKRKSPKAMTAKAPGLSLSKTFPAMAEAEETKE